MSERNQVVSHEPVRRAMMAIDIASFGDPSRSDEVQLYLRETLYKIVREGFDASNVPWHDCYHEDRGDGILTIAPPDVDAFRLVDPMLLQLAASIRRHNEISSAAAQIRLRIAVHVGDVEFDTFGVSGSAANHIFRLLDAQSFKEELGRSDFDVGLITSDYFYDSVVRHGLIMLDPAGFKPIRVQVKETDTRGWVHIPGLPANAPHMSAQDRMTHEHKGDGVSAMPSAFDVDSGPDSPPAYRVIICVDTERLSDPGRMADAQFAMRASLYSSLNRAFAESKIPWEGEGYHEDRGDGLLFMVGPDVSPARLVEPLLFELAAELGRQNHDHPQNRIRLRIAIHAGFVRHDTHGIIGSSISRAFRLLDTPALKEALREAPGDLALIASEEFYRNYIQHQRRLDQPSYRKVQVTDKESYIDAWICTSDTQLRAGHEYGRRVPRIEADLKAIEQAVAKAREDRAVTGSKISSPVPDIPDLTAEVRDRLTALNIPRTERRWSDLITEVTELERAANASLTEARTLHRTVREPLDRREELRGLLESYQAMVREQGRVEDLHLAKLYRQARDLLWRTPCDLPEAESATMRYVRAIQEDPPRPPGSEETTP